MKKFMIAVLVTVSVSAMSCQKENVSPTSSNAKKQIMSGGGDKIPSGTYD